MLAYLAASVLKMIPITPGGLGFVEAGLAVTLVWAGLSAANATLATLAYRLVSYWLPLIAGVAAAVIYRHRYPAPGVVPNGSVPSGVVSTGAVPAGAVATGSVPAGVVPAGVVPAGVVSTGAVPVGAVPSENWAKRSSREPAGVPIGSTLIRVPVTCPGPYSPVGAPSPVNSMVNSAVKICPSALTSPAARISPDPSSSNSTNVRLIELGPVASQDPMPLVPSELAFAERSRRRGRR